MPPVTVVPVVPVVREVLVPEHEPAPAPTLEPAPPVVVPALPSAGLKELDIFAGYAPCKFCDTKFAEGCCVDDEKLCMNCRASCAFIGACSVTSASGLSHCVLDVGNLSHFSHLENEVGGRF